MNLLTLNNKTLVLKESGGGGAKQTGFSVAFPETAGNWSSNMNAALWLADGTTTLINTNNYSNVAGKTIDNVIGFYAYHSGTSDVVKMTISGSVAVCSQSRGYGVTTDGTTPATFTMGGAWLAFFFLSDATITSLEMYNVD